MHTSIIDHISQIETLLPQMKAQGPVTDPLDLQRRHQERLSLEGHLHAIAGYIHETRSKMEQLRQLAPLSLVQWTQSLLAFPNLALLEVDTSGLGPHAEVLRVLLLDPSGTVLFDICIKPSERPAPQALYVNGLSVEHDLLHAPSPEKVWPALTAALRGRYILSYNLEFDLKALNALATRLAQPPPIVIGTCLMEQSLAYFKSTSYPKLAALCQRIGSALPEPPHQTALHRATGQLRLLHAMAQGITDVTPPARSAVPESAEDDGVGDVDDDHPF